MSHFNKFRKGILGIGVFLFVLLFGVSTIYGIEANTTDIILETISEEEIEELEEEIEEIDIVDEVTYIEVIETIVKTLNERDSYFYEIINPTDIIKYIKDVGIEIPEDLEIGVTRVEFARLLTDIIVAVTGDRLYETDLIHIQDIFTDLEGLSGEEIKDIETVFIMGLLSGVSSDRFSPNSLITQYQFDIVMNRLKEGYTRQNIYNITKSGYSEEERLTVLEGKEDKVLNYQDMISFLYMFSEFPKFDEFRKEDLTIGEFLDLYYNESDYQILVQDLETQEYYYPAKDTIILSAEEWEYLNTHKDKIMMYSEAKLFTLRIKEAKETIQEYNHFDNFEEVDMYTKNYLGFTYDIVKGYEPCISTFMDYTYYNAIQENYDDFSRAIHEAQHEGSAKLSNRYAGRRKTEDLWQIRWNSKPSIYYYFDFTNSIWVDSKVISSPNTSSIYNKKCSEGVKENDFLKDYATNSDYISNIYGIQGLLQEYCSYGLQSKIEFISESLDLDEASIGHTDYDWYLLMKYMVIESLEYLKENYNSSYITFMSDMDMVRLLNNTFEEMDYYEYVYRDELSHYMFWFSDDLLNWGYNLGSPVCFGNFDELELEKETETLVE